MSKDRTVQVQEQASRWRVISGVQELLDFQNRVTSCIGLLLSGYADVYQKNTIVRLMRELGFKIEELRE